MKNLRKQSLLASTLAALAAPVVAQADLVAQFPMDVRSGQIVESVSGNRFKVEGHFAPENIPGAVGQALRFDGYTSHVNARLNNILSAEDQNMTVSLWVALPCYPIIEIDRNTNEKTAIISCIDEKANSGFGFFLGFNGKWSFKCYIGGWPVEINVDTPLPVYQWNNLTAVADSSSRTLTLYLNGNPVGSTRAKGSVELKASELRMGRGTLENYSGPFLLTSFNGLIDDISVWNEAIPQQTIASWKPENPADLDIPASRFAGQLLRPRFHGMPAAAWTNECHGMTYSDGRYHLFFQKNADGPYMARLHWGHISSENLYDWREEKIAIAPGDPYDIKGCWSGCVFTDPEITGNRPAALYTAVDYGRASIAGASPTNASLNDWNKWSDNPIIAHRPDGLSDDFRDPYFFRNGDNAYIIVGSSKNGIGTTTLHRYDSASKTWSNDGATFFSGTSVAADGTFWEMPNITPMENGKWIFTATPLGTQTGVHTMYWIGSIDEAGRFQPDSNFTSGKNVEMNSRDGFGLLSPTIYNHEGKTIVLGIVPDKLPSQDNWNLGWAHCYSLPREWSIGSDGLLNQKPFSGLEGMRSNTAFSRENFSLDGTLDLAPVEGREAEILGTFTVGSNPFGFKIFSNSSAEGTITYNPLSGQLTADFSRLNRLVNDNNVYNGIYTCTLPEFLKRGSEMKINLFIDHSIIDIFVNDRWATSIRVFPTDADATGISAFSEGETKVTSLKAWKIDADSFGSGVAGITLAPIEFEAEGGNINYANLPVGSRLSIYDLSGRCLMTRNLPSTEGTIETGLSGLHLLRLTTPTATTTRKLLLN